MFHFAAAPEALVCAGAGISTFLLSWKQVKLHSSEVYKTIQTNVFIEGFNIAKLLKMSDDGW